MGGELNGNGEREWKGVIENLEGRREARKSSIRIARVRKKTGWGKGAKGGFERSQEKDMCFIKEREE